MHYNCAEQSKELDAPLWRESGQRARRDTAMSDLLTPQPTTQELRNWHRTLSGSEMKALTALFWLEETPGARTNVEAIAAEANLSRATVFRATNMLRDSGLIEYRTTPEGRAVATYALSALGQAVSNSINTLHNRQPQTAEQKYTDESRFKNETPVSKRDGLTANFETRVSNCDSPRGDHPPVNKDLPKYKQVNPYHLRPDDQTRAVELAKSSSRQLADEKSVGLHILVWQAALHTDNRNGNNNCEAELTRILFVLRAQKQEQQRPQGAAWNARTKTCFERWGITDPIHRRASTAPAGNHGEAHP